MKNLRLRKDLITAMAKVNRDSLQIVQDQDGNCYTVEELPGFTILLLGPFDIDEGIEKELVYVGERAYLCDEVTYEDHMHVLKNPIYIGQVQPIMY